MLQRETKASSRRGRRLEPGNDIFRLSAYLQLSNATEVSQSRCIGNINGYGEPTVLSSIAFASVISRAVIAFFSLYPSKSSIIITPSCKARPTVLSVPVCAETSVSIGPQYFPAI